MREILFRGKRVDGGEWCYGVPLVEGWSKKTYIASYEYSSLTFIQQIEIIPETLGQFTGLTDKNGKRIFEGDILQDVFDEERMYEILYGEQTLMFEYRKIGYKGDGEPLWFMNKGEWWNARSCFEIIGNRFDNPELLTD